MKIDSPQLLAYAPSNILYAALQISVVYAPQAFRIFAWAMVITFWTKFVRNSNPTGQKDKVSNTVTAVAKALRRVRVQNGNATRDGNDKGRPERSCFGLVALNGINTQKWHERFNHDLCAGNLET